MRRSLLSPAVGAAVLGLAGCGLRAQTPPDPTLPGADFGGHTVDYPAAGLRFQAPNGWSTGEGPAPLVARFSAGSDNIAVWRYPRTEPLPATPAALRAARDALLETVRTRDATFAPRRTKILRVGGHPAIRVVGRGRIEGLAREITSTHIYAEGAELVFDAYAQDRDFARMRRRVVAPLLRSLRIRAAGVKAAAG